MNIKKILSVFTLLAIVITACSQAPSFIIKGRITGLADGTELELVPGATHRDEKAIATNTVANGQFAFKRAAEGPRLYIVRVKGSYAGVSVMLDKGTVNLSGRVNITQESNGIKRYNFNDVKVEGSSLHDMYLKKVSVKNKMDSAHNAYQIRFQKISEEISNARKSKNKAMVDSLFNTVEGKAFTNAESNFFKNVEATYTSAITASKDSWWGPFLMLYFMAYFTDDNKPLFESFSPDAKASYYGQIVKNELYPVGLVGKKVPALKLQDKDKNVAAIASLQKGKKYVLIDFWASWCAPCRKEIPNLKAIYEKYAPMGLQIISISIDKKESDWTKALGEEKLPWPNFLDNATTNAASSFGVKLIPSIFLVDEKGIVIYDKLRGKELDDKLGELFQ